MKALFLFFILTFVAACDRIDFSDMATTFAATGAAIGTAVVTTNPMAIGAVTAGGAIAGAVIVEDDKSLSTEQISEVQNPWQALLVAFDQLLAHAWEIVIAIGIAVVGIPMLITYVLGKAKQRPEDAKSIQHLVEKVAKMKEHE